MPIFSESLEQSLQQALAFASASGREHATLEDLLLALTDDADATAVFRACDVDLEKLRRDLISFTEPEVAEFDTGATKGSKRSVAFERVVQRTATRMQHSGRQEITAANVLVEILTERESQASAVLERQAMTRYDAMLYISHGIAKSGQLSSRRMEAPPRDLSEIAAGPAKVLLLNNDYTPMEFVVHVLERVFEKDHETAEQIMFETHNHGVGTCGLYPCEVARTKVGEVLDLAREQQHPLQCVMEPSASN